MLVVVGGGRLLDRRFGGHMKARVAYRGHQAVYVSPISSLVTQFMLDHPHRSLESARRKVRRSLRIPGFFDFAGDLADRGLFDGRSFVRQARGHGGFDRFIRRRARHLGSLNAHPSALAPESCWQEAAQTTAGFAKLMGFTGVPSPPALPACSLGGSASASVAHASGIPGLEVFGVLTSVASLVYGVASGQSTGAELAEIKAQLNEVQAELQEIQAELGGLQTEVAAVNANVVSGTESNLIADAVTTITSIKRAGSETMALLGAASQVLCESAGRCSVPEGSVNLGQALDTACAKETVQCEAFYTDLYFTSRALEGARPLKSVENLGSWADGSAYSGAGSAGIVQYALEQGAGDEQFFQTADVADARLQWAYYTLYSAYAQTTYATVLSMGIGQPLPNSKSKHPPSLSAGIVREQVDALNKPISLQMAVFPNMPDTAVIDTNLGAQDNDPPFMFAQQVGGLASASAYVANREYALSKSNVSSGSIYSSDASGAYLSTLQTSGEPPLVMTPAAASGETWELLPGGGKRSRPPAVSTATFSDWTTAGSSSSSPLPEWNPTTEKVEATDDPPAGPLPDLYGGAKPSSGQMPGQWMTSKSGIESKLMTPEGTGYGSAVSGVVAYFAKSGTDTKDPGLGFVSCVPGGDDECLLPTWQSTSINPYDQVSSEQSYNSGSGQINTGLFDFNGGLVIANQQGHEKNESRGFYEELPANFSAFLNQYPNWSNFAEIRGVGFYGFLEALNGGAPGSLRNASFSSKGRPVLFSREQTANDCFYWSSSGSGAAFGSGCLKKREHSGEILP